MNTNNGDPRSLRGIDTTPFAMMGLDAAATSSALVYLQSELEKADRRVLEPLAAVTWPRDIFTDIGGGWMDYSSNFFADYGNSDTVTLGLTGTETTEISRVQVNINKEVYPLHNWQVVSDVKIIDLLKLKGAGRSLDDLYAKAVALKYNKTVDRIVYLGVPATLATPGSTGLLNNILVTTAAAATGASGGTAWNTKTPQEILTDINAAIINTVTASGYDVSGMADTILIPWPNFNYLLQPVTLAGSVSILEYVKANNVAKAHGIELKIFPVGWASSAYAGSNIMVAYRNDKDRVRFDITVPVQRGVTVPSVTHASYDTLWQAQIGVVKALYPTSLYYTTGI
jgi:hypothetical protein